MNISHVVVECASLCKALPTYMTRVRLLAGVGATMLYQVLVEGEAFLTDLALVRFEVNVTAIVPLERAQHLEILETNGTGKRAQLVGVGQQGLLSYLFFVLLMLLKHLGLQQKGHALVPAIVPVDCITYPVKSGRRTKFRRVSQQNNGQQIVLIGY